MGGEVEPDPRVSGLKMRLGWPYRLLAGPLVSVVSLLASVAVLESAAAVWELLRGGPSFAASHAFGHLTPDGKLGLAHRRDFRYEAKLVVDQRVAYEARYTYDHRGRRVTPIVPRATPDQFVLWFGCSFVDGTGVEDADTMAAALARLAPRYRPYNYGLGSSGPQQMLLQLSDPSFGDDIGEREGIALYVYLDFHVQRAIGSMRVFNSFGRNFPYFAIDSTGRLEQRGTFATGWPPWKQLAYRVLGKSRVLRSLDVDLPPETRRRDVELVARILSASRDAFLSWRPKGSFYVVIYPGQKTVGLTDHLRERGVEYVDLSGLFDPDQPGLSIPGDGHPTPLANQRLAEALSERLGLHAR